MLSAIMDESEIYINNNVLKKYHKYKARTIDHNSFLSIALAFIE